MVGSSHQFQPSAETEIAEGMNHEHDPSDRGKNEKGTLWILEWETGVGE